MDYVFPKFGDRVLGLHAPVGKLANINAILIIVLVPTIGALTQRFAAYRMVVIGGAICAAGVFIMALPPVWFVSAANGLFGQWLGHSLSRLEGSIQSLLHHGGTVSDGLLRRRSFLFAASLRVRRRHRPAGQEASYGALAYLPFLIGKLLVGTAGWILAAFCPAEGPRRPAMMWLIFALAASVAPIGLLLFRRYIRVPEAGRQE